MVQPPETAKHSFRSYARGLILPFPLATSAEIAGVLRPGTALRSDSALRTLRENGLAGKKVSVVPRAAGAARGRAVWYSSLMLDVARLYRWHDLEAARAVLAKADDLASSRAARFLAETLSGSDVEPTAGELDTLTGGALSRMALLTGSARNQVAGMLRVRRSTGTIIARAGDLAIVETEDGVRLGVPCPPVESANIGAVGAEVAIDTEQLDTRSSFVWVRSAFEPATDRHTRVPGSPRLLTEEERRHVARDVLVVG